MAADSVAIEGGNLIQNPPSRAEWIDGGFAANEEGWGRREQRRGRRQRGGEVAVFGKVS